MNRISKLMVSAAAISAGLSPALPAFAADSELTVFDWAGFEEPSIFQGYVDKYGDVPTYAFFGDDDEAFQKVSSGFKADVTHPCSSAVQKYRDADLIEPWDVSKIAAFGDIDPKFLNSPVFKDDKGVWFLPTDWGVSAIAYAKGEVPDEDVASLDVFVNPKYEGRISLPDSADDVWSLAYLATGVTDWSDVTDEQFKAAADWLREANKLVRSYWSDPSEMAQLMASGEVLVAWSWNDGIAYLKDDGFDVGFQREAKEGSSTWFCGYVNMKDGPGSEEKAYDFMNAWLAPSSAQGLLDAIGYGHSNSKGMAELPAEEVADAGLGPIKAPILAQTPISAEQREKQLQEFEQIKAGF
ncbi:ABC transporter substrate-binding protein [Frigidibacter sp. MR17.24]|uniref:ABC transporter substrate-binding protein n=1 Tax=Frigidibacter sp. MR17.24 TaxID=3127345 RepID=UPI0030130CE4